MSNPEIPLLVQLCMNLTREGVVQNPLLTNSIEYNPMSSVALHLSLECPLKGISPTNHICKECTLHCNSGNHTLVVLMKYFNGECLAIHMHS